MTKFKIKTNSGVIEIEIGIEIARKWHLDTISLMATTEENSEGDEFAEIDFDFDSDFDPEKIES